VEERREEFGENNNFDSNIDNNVKNHTEIVNLIEDIKKIEEKIPKFDVPDYEILEEQKCDNSEIRFQEVNEIDNVKTNDFEDPNFSSNISEKPSLKLRSKGDIEKQEFEEVQQEIPQVEFEEVTQKSIPVFRKKRQEIKPATFKIRFNEEGNLENIDLKKKSDKKLEFKFIKKLKLDKISNKIKKRKTKDSEDKKETEQESSGKLSKITNIFGKVKNVTKIIDKLPIPKRGGKSSKKEVKNEEENEEE